jgi:hypothetical protein
LLLRAVGGHIGRSGANWSHLVIVRNAILSREDRYLRAMH